MSESLHSKIGYTIKIKLDFKSLVSRRVNLIMAGSFRANCYKKVCSMCIHRGAKKILGGYECRSGHRPSQNACFYFTCQGKGEDRCAKCTDHMANKRHGIR